MVEVRNARILSTFIGREGHGIPTASINLDYGGVHQSFGGYNLKHPAHQMFVFRVLEIVGAESWEDLPGHSLRVKSTPGRVIAIGHLLKDEWFDPSQEAEAFQAMEKVKNG